MANPPQAGEKTQTGHTAGRLIRLDLLVQNLFPSGGSRLLRSFVRTNKQPLAQSSLHSVYRGWSEAGGGASRRGEMSRRNFEGVLFADAAVNFAPAGTNRKNR